MESQKGVFSMKNTIKLKAIQRMAGLIAFAAITGFAMTSYGPGNKEVLDAASLL
jgi:hypothetical protein